MPRSATLLATGAAAALGARALLVRAIFAQFQRSVASLNEGDYHPLLDQYADDAVLAFAEGPHRWSGKHRGKAELERFFQDFTAARLRGEISDLHVAGPPWAMTMMVRFDDRADGPDGERLYGNRVVVMVRTRWGKIVEHEDFYENTSRIDEFDRRLSELGIEPVGRGLSPRPVA